MDCLKISLVWKITKVLKSNLVIQENNLLFNISPNTGLYNRLGISLNHSYVPKILRPTIIYHQAIKKRLVSNIKIDEKKFPYSIFIPDLNTKVTLNIKIRLFPLNILSLTVTVSDLPGSLDANQLINYQKLSQHKPIHDIIQWTIHMAETLNHNNYNPLQSCAYNSTPIVNLEGVCLPEVFQDHINENISKYIGILIRNANYETINGKIQEKIIEKNHEHNLNYPQEHLLIDNKGSLYINSIETKIHSQKKTTLFFKSIDLFEIAKVFREYLVNYPSFRVQNEDLADFFFYKIRPWIETPEVIFGHSLFQKHLWELLIIEFGLKANMKSVMKSTTPQIIETKSRCFDQYLIGWWNKNDFALLLSNEINEEKTKEMEKNISDKAPNTINMRDQYYINNAVAVGPRAHAHDIKFNQIWNENKNDIDLSVLAKELAKLRIELKKEGSEPDHDISIGAIASAESSAREGDGQKTLEYLSKTGKWALDVATKIGVPVATEALKKAIGL